MTDFKKSFWHKKLNGEAISVDMLPADFHEAEVVNVDFSNLNLSKSDFAHAHLKNCLFCGCDLTGVSFFGAALENCDFTEAHIFANQTFPARLTTFPEDLSGCIFDDKGLQDLEKLGVISADAEKRREIWEKNHPVRERWFPGGKLDSAWN